MEVFELIFRLIDREYDGEVRGGRDVSVVSKTKSLPK